MELLEREAALASAEAALAEAAAGSGRVVVVAGEAGVGKTVLVAELAARQAGRARVLLGGCDPLITPRALGPFHDLARQAGGAMARALSGGVREELVAAALDELGAGPPPRLMVIEDAHWADEGTLDLLALLGRRVERTTGALLVTTRSDEIGPALRAALGGMPASAVRRIDLAPLSPAAVEEMARRAGREASGLHDATGGNPFFVTEILAAEGTGVPGTVRDAVLSRAARLSPAARDALDLVSVVPGRAELWLAVEALGVPESALEECIEGGMLQTAGPAVGFRHEIARSSVEADLSSLRRGALERRVLEALTSRPGTDPARVVHHARRAGDGEAVLRHAPAAARAASAAGAHRQAAEHLRAAVEAAGELPDPERAGLLEALSFETYLCGQTAEALTARREALAIRTRLGDAAGVGENERWLARLLWWAGRREEAETAGARAIAVLEPLGPSPELAMAYSNQSQLAMLSWRHPEAIAWGERAIALARRLDARDALAHALTNVGTARMATHEAEGVAALEEAIATSIEEGFHDHAARALVNLAWGWMMRRQRGACLETIVRGLSFAERHDLRAYHQYLLSMRAWCRMEQGDWPSAEDDARMAVAMFEAQPNISGHLGLIVLGRLGARRGDPAARALLDEAWRWALRAEEPQRVGPAGAACAELAWLDGDTRAVERFAGAALEAAGPTGEPWFGGEAAFLLWRVGALDEAPADFEEPYRLSIAGDWAGAAAEWERFGCPYQAAEARWHADDESAVLQALETFDRLGATRPAALLRAELRGRGARTVPRGPRRSTRESPHGLTARQLQVLALLGEGATNAEIAERLVLSTRTVDHHVAAILGKLGVTSRREAAAVAHELVGETAKGGQPAG